MANNQHIFKTKEENFELRPWGGRMCFLSTEERTGCNKIIISAVLHMEHGLCHDGHVHDDMDEILFVLDGIGRHIFWDDDGNEKSYEIHPDDVLYIAKNRKHCTQNCSAEKELELFIINYIAPVQSDLKVSGMIPVDSIPWKDRGYVSTADVIQEKTCGNNSIAGGFLTLQPDSHISFDEIKDEELVFVLDGDAEISYNGSEGRQAFEKASLGFFKCGDNYSLYNGSNAPVRFIRLYTL